jgi:3'-5' exoribonuclease-like protein
VRFFLDTEFIEDGKTIDLISIGIVAENGKEYYAEFCECDLTKANDWVKANVLPHLTAGFGKLRSEIAKEIVAFVDDCGLKNADGTPSRYGKVEFWGYYADYDWVALCQLYGRMIDLPKGWPMYCRDLKQLLDDNDNPKMPKPTQEHNALSDARWNKWVHGKLMSACP